ncbi:MAG: hypothetical protein QMD71_02695 [bacterium]|nr:hypothetical protein [bacterium]
MIVLARVRRMLCNGEVRGRGVLQYAPIIRLRVKFNAPTQIHVLAPHLLEGAGFTSMN